jgi:hypothetical protein
VPHVRLFGPGRAQTPARRRLNHKSVRPSFRRSRKRSENAWESNSQPGICHPERVRLGDEPKDLRFGPGFSILSAFFAERMGDGSPPPSTNLGAPGPSFRTGESTNPIPRRTSHKSGCPRSVFSDLGEHRRQRAVDEQALKAAMQYRFKPATLDGVPVACPITVAMNFRLGL